VDFMLVAIIGIGVILVRDKMHDTLRDILEELRRRKP
jgi:hypothetical protein